MRQESRTTMCSLLAGRFRRLAVLILLIVWGPAYGLGQTACKATDEGTLRSKSGIYCVHYRSELDPIVINRMHSWVIHVEMANGEPVEDATITVGGGMPAHDHGLPTSPRVTKYLGNGDYLIEGMRFHMNGYWEITLAISADRDRDTVIIPLEL